MKRIAGVVALVAALVSCSGCLMLLAGGTAGVREVTDKVVTYKGDVAAVENAVRKAMKDMGAVVKEVSREEGDKAAKRTIRGKTYDDEVLTIDMEPTSPSLTQVEIRVGRIGSKSRAKEFQTALQKYLKAVDSQ